ncbi:MAG: PhaM family polyhydroxyalkanoate granule multifunctional regulatory protein [Casimicrobiaceae bacterium]
MSDAADSKPDAKPFAFSPQDAAEFMQRMWNPLGIPVPGFDLPGTIPGAPPIAFPNPSTLFATIDPAQIERKIAELKVVENWLAMSLSMIQMSTKALELQHAALNAMRPKSAAPSTRQPKK